MNKMILIFTLVSLGAAVIAVNKDLNLWNSVTRGDQDGVTHALNNGANLDWKNPQKEGLTALHQAAEHNYSMIVRSLLDAGADKNIRDDEGRTAVYFASQNGSIDALAVLISRGADVNIPAINTDKERYYKKYNYTYKLELGETALYVAAKYNQSIIARLLLAAGADINARDEGGETPVITAAYYGSIDVLSILIAQGADINTFNDVEGLNIIASLNPLMAAVKQGHFKAAEVLIKAHANVTITNDIGGTALHAAARNNRTAIARLLLENGANPNQTWYRINWSASDLNGSIILEVNGTTPGDSARSQGFYPLADMIDGIIPTVSTTSTAAPQRVLLITAVMYWVILGYTHHLRFSIL